VIPYPTRESIAVVEVQVQILGVGNAGHGIVHRASAIGQGGIGDRTLGTDDDLAATRGRELQN
jgi:hypothetical protein